jgi:ABC-type nitrate/sulfonate/bicarbonate transport system permease component
MLPKCVVARISWRNMAAGVLLAELATWGLPSQGVVVYYTLQHCGIEAAGILVIALFGFALAVFFTETERILVPWNAAR